MSLSLQPVLANIILTELERIIVFDQIADGSIIFYKCYIDNTLVLMKPSNISAVLTKFNSFVSILTSISQLTLFLMVLHIFKT